MTNYSSHVPRTSPRKQERSSSHQRQKQENALESKSESTQSSRSAALGATPTEYECWLGFYDLGQQGGWWAKLLSVSHVTHVGPIIEVPAVNYELTITISNGDATIASSAALEKMGAKLLHKIPIGKRKLDLAQVVNHAKLYTDTTVLDCLMWTFVTRWFGCTRPRQCTTYVCHLFDLEECWHPHDLLERYL